MNNKTSNASNLYQYSNNSSPTKNKEISKSPKIRDTNSFGRSSLRGSLNGFENKLFSARNSMTLLSSCPQSPNQLQKQVSNHKKMDSYSIKNQKVLKIPGLKIVNTDSKVNPTLFSYGKKNNHKVQSFDALIKKVDVCFSKNTNDSKKHIESLRDKSADALSDKNDKLKTQKLGKSSPNLVLASKENIFKKKALCDKTYGSKLFTETIHTRTSDKINNRAHLQDNEVKSKINITQISGNQPIIEQYDPILMLPIANNKLHLNRSHKSEKKNHQESKFQNKLYNYILDNSVSFID